MKAVRVHEFGGPEVLSYEDVAVPEPGPGEARVKLAAAGVNFIDVYQRTGLYPGDLPRTLGLEGAGEVEAVGEGVEDLAVGDYVAFAMAPGAYAEYVVVPAAKLVPFNVTLVEARIAAAVMLQGMTAHYLTHSTFPLEEGHTALVHAAAGGVGTLAVQMAKLLGAGTVIATASSREKLDLARSLGADVLIDYTKEDWPEKVREATEGRGADVILEMVGGDFPEKNLRCLAVFGRMVVFGAASGERGTIVPVDLMKRCHAVVGFYLPRVMSRPELFVPSMREVLGWTSSGDLKLTIGASYPLEKAAEAHADLEGRRTTGKLLLHPEDP